MHNGANMGSLNKSAKIIVFLVVFMVVAIIRDYFFGQSLSMTAFSISDAIVVLITFGVVFLIVGDPFK